MRWRQQLPVDAHRLNLLLALTVTAICLVVGACTIESDPHVETSGVDFGVPDVDLAFAEELETASDSSAAERGGHPFGIAAPAHLAALVDPPIDKDPLPKTSPVTPTVAANPIASTTPTPRAGTGAVPTATPRPTVTPRSTNTPVPTATPRPTPPGATATPTPAGSTTSGSATAAPTGTPTATPTGTAAPTSATQPSPTAEPVSTPTPTSAPTTVASATATPTATAPAPTAPPVATAIPTATPCPHTALGDTDGITSLPVSERLAIADDVIECSGVEAFGLEALGGIDLGNGVANIDFVRQIPEALESCLGRMLVSGDRDHVLLGMVALSATEPVATEDRAATLAALSKCAPPSGAVGPLVAALVPEAPEFVQGVNPACAALGYAEDAATAAFWNQVMDEPAFSVTDGLNGNDLTALFGPILDCMSLGAVIVNDAAANGVAVPPTTAQCIDDALAGTGVLIDLFTGVLDPDDSSIASVLIDCLSV